MLCNTFSFHLFRCGILLLTAKLISLIGLGTAQAQILSVEKERSTIGESGDYIPGLAISPDGKTLASSSSGGISLWDLTNEKERTKLPRRMAASRLQYSSDGKVLVATGHSEIFLLDPATGAEISQLNPSRIAVFRFGLLTKDGKTLITAASGNYKDVELWSVDSGMQIDSLKGHAKGASTGSLSPDGKTLATGDNDGMIKIWDLASRKEIATLNPEVSVKCEWRCVSFSPDGKTLAASGMGKGGTLQLWDVATGKTKPTKAVQRDEAYSIAFTPDGKRIVSGSALSGTASLWDVSSGEQKAVFHGTNLIRGIWSVAITPDGKTLVAGCGDGRIKFWDIPK